MIQNLAAASAGRKPSSLGRHLKQVDAFTGAKVANVLKAAEMRYPFVGTSLIPIFFPGAMRVPEAELKFWTRAENLRKAENDQGVSKRKQGIRRGSGLTARMNTR